MEEIDLKGKTVMVVGAHPDDNDFTAGGTAAKAAKLGNRVIYVVATKGNRGSNDPEMTPDALWETRKKEQEEACKLLGVEKIEFLGHNDGELVADITLKEQITRMIRKYKPDIIFTMDPSKFYFKERNFVNHTDHRAVGEATMDAVYPLARDRLSFPHHEKENLQPHTVKELCFVTMNPDDANSFMNVTDTMNLKISALKKHTSQIPNTDEMEKRVREWSAKIGEKAQCQNAEGFVRIKFDR